MITYDFRSDTVTKPTPEMREAMAQAVVGDDVYGEDPSVNELQEIAASMTGQESALFVPSGTMGNLAAFLAHCQRGDEVILGKQAHTFYFEAGGLAALCGVQPFTLENNIDGTLNLNDIEKSIRGDNPHFPRTSLITIENTHNLRGGVPLTAEYTNQVSEIAKKHNLKFHIDGARIFNAAVSQNLDVNQLTAMADSVTFCLSKGLSSPLGSVLCGSKPFIYKAHRARKQLGGAMRQAGIVAAAGIVSLNTMVDRLADDHALADILALGLSKIEGIDINLEEQHTNMVYFNLLDEVELTDSEFVGKLKKQGVLLNASAKRRFRMVTHAWVNTDAVTQALSVIKDCLSR